MMEIVTSRNVQPHFSYSSDLCQVRAALEESHLDLHEAPLAEILFCLGFFVLYFVEELVHVTCDPKLHQHPCPETVHK